MAPSPILNELLELTRAACGADLLELVISGAPGSSQVACRAGFEQHRAGVDDRAADQQLLVNNAQQDDGATSDWVGSFMSTPITGPSAEPGWIVAAAKSRDVFSSEALDALGRAAVLVEDRLDRALERVRIDDLGAQLRASQLELRETQDRLELSNQELEQFAYIAAHELVAPLRSVAVYAEVLDARTGLNDMSDDQRRECVTEIRHGLQRMTRQVQYLLELSSAQSSTDQNPTEIVPLNNVVQAAIDTLAEPLADVDADVTVSELPVVAAAAIPLQSVFANLISNSIRYRDPERQLKLWISSEMAEEGPRVHFTDNGPGIEPENRRRIFRLFERASTTQEGSGIGLALSRRILEAFGASIGVEDGANGGATFWIQFPNSASVSNSVGV